MDEFWGGVAVLIAVALVLLALNGNGETASINFTDLETECRSGGEVADYRVMSDNSIEFSGRFPESNTRASLGHDYSEGREKIVLNVRSEAEPVNGSFEDDCLASVVYTARTGPIDDGSYVVEVQHNGKSVKKQLVELD